MRVKKIGAILAGAVMIGSAVAAAAESAIDPSFYVDPETGQPNAIVVVGANAAASDVTAGAWVAAYIGSMAYIEDTTTDTEVYEFFSGKNYHDDHGDNVDDQNDNGSDNADAILINNVLDATWPSASPFTSTPGPYGALGSLWWDDKELTPDGEVDVDESREEVFLDLGPFMASMKGNMSMFYPTVDLYNYVYRTVVEDMPLGTYWLGGEFNYDPYWLVTDPVTVKFLGYFYDIIDRGTDPVYGDYVVYGTPHWSETECRGDDLLYFEVGVPINFNGWEVTLKDVNIYENKVKWLIQGPNDEEPCEYFVVVSSWYPDVDPMIWNWVYDELDEGLGSDLHPTNKAVYEYIITHANEPFEIQGIYYEIPDLHRCFSPVSQDKECEYDVIGINDKICDLPYTVFALDTVKLFVGATGVTEAAARLYALTDYGIIHDAVCVRPCGAEGLQWDLDVEFLDLMTPPMSIEYWDGNPYYLLGGLKNWESIGLVGPAPPAYLKALPNWWAGPNEWDNIPAAFDNTTFEPIILNMKLHSTLDVRICGAQVNVPLCEWDFPMCGIDDFDFNVADAPIYITLSVDDSDDWDHLDLIINGGFTITQEVVTGTTTTLEKVNIDPMSITKSDDEITETMKAANNLVLVGGPGLVVCVGATPQIANTLTDALVKTGDSKVDWATSIGEYEYIADAFVEGRDVVIVAGTDREATRHAVELLLTDLGA